MFLPQLERNEAPLDFFVRVNHWRRHHNIPWEVYARIVEDWRGQPTASEGLADEERHDQSREDQPTSPERRLRQALNRRKPQYVDFGNPLLVNVFGKLLQGAGASMVVLEERYPGRSHLPSCDGGKFSTQLALELDVHDPTRPKTLVEEGNASAM
jgi:hypothetical protein